MKQDAAFWIRTLGLQKHPEGGYFRETYRAGERVPASALPDRYGGPRVFSTAIYFLLEGSDFSALHRIRSDELWHFYAGSALTVHVLHPAGEYERLRLGPDPGRGERFQAAVCAGCWFGARLDDPESYALVGCTVAPGFDFADFELGDRADLLARYPRNRAVVEALTRQAPSDRH